MAKRQEAPDYLLLGEVLRPHGVRGELRVRLFTDYPERINTIETVFVGLNPEDTAPRPYKVEHMRMHKGYGLLKLKDINDRNDADRLRERYIMIDLGNAVPLEDDEFYLFQLIGLDVVTESGEVLGEISDILETGANDVYIVQGEKYGEILIPVTDESVIEIDFEKEQVTVNLPEGLLPS